MNDCEMGPGAERRVATVSTGERARGIARAGNAGAWGMKMAMAAALVVGVASEGSAGFELKAEHIIDPPGASGSAPNPGESTIVEHINENSEYGALNSGAGVTDLGELLFKWERDNNAIDHSRQLASSYELIDLVSDGKNGGTIRYVGSGDIVNPLLPSWLVVKNGNAGWVTYDLGDTGSFGVEWNGLDDLTFTNAGLLKSDGTLKDISNVQIWGGAIDPSLVPPPPPGGSVPEPSSFAIWGVCLGALGLVIRRRMVASVV